MPFLAAALLRDVLSWAMTYPLSLLTHLVRGHTVQTSHLSPCSQIHVMPKGRAERCHDPFSGSSCSSRPIHIMLGKWASWALLQPSLPRHFHMCSDSPCVERQDKLSTTTAPPPRRSSTMHKFHDGQESRQSSHTQALLINATLPPTWFCLLVFWMSLIFGGKPSIMQLRHRDWRNSFPILHEFLNSTGQTKVVSSFPSVPSSIHEFQMQENHTDSTSLYQCSLVPGICLVLLTWLSCWIQPWPLPWPSFTTVWIS